MAWSKVKPMGVFTLAYLAYSAGSARRALQVRERCLSVMVGKLPIGSTDLAPCIVTGGIRRAGGMTTWHALVTNRPMLSTLCTLR